MDFSQALVLLKVGKKVCREGWNGKGMFIYYAAGFLPFPPLPEDKKWDSTSFDASTFIVMKTADKKLIPWLASQTDILAEDWQEVGGQ